MMIAWLVLWAACSASAQSITYRAAVIEFAGQYTPNAEQPRLTRAKALASMRRNVAAIDALVGDAAQQGAQIVVVPEDSLYGCVHRLRCVC